MVANIGADTTENEPSKVCRSKQAPPTPGHKFRSGGVHAEVVEDLDAVHAEVRVKGPLDDARVGHVRARAEAEDALGTLVAEGHLR